ncbi:inositol-tetrakisphosphate 1-kinase 4-like [Dorcoceras hygrometricum]|uniref:inositol-1,3,4-trisphosphate 5/6-kinase n=1 Tax=Dorcoceras hygrometricum TaxID=472368 RepID=A0A2Z7CZE7_9LAMI|nr:inositol-tetrakisphosphate 1-kinase 4-like [Dorcoceras hygrometricum]
MGGVRGILLDSSVLLPSDDGDLSGEASLLPGADYVLRKLRYSEIPTGISHGLDLGSPKMHLLQETARIYSFDCFFFNLTSDYDISGVVAHKWEDNGGALLHVVSSYREDLCHKGSGSRWMKVIVDAESIAAAGMLNIFLIHKLEELLLLICHLNKKATDAEALILGYAMKASREEDFAKRGAFPLRPTQNGLIFLPLSYELPILPQLQEVDAVLHKATDEILAVDLRSSVEICEKVTFTKNLQELRRYIECQMNCCVIDPFNNIFPVLDRLRIQQILIGLEALNMQGRCKIRAPNFLQVDSFDLPSLEQRLAEAKLSLPNIVKPQVACGVADAHSMAIVFNVHHYKDLTVPLPAVVQEYVDHSSLLYKFYALGGKVFYAVKKSIPNAVTLMNLFDDGLKPLHFDSLKSLPTSKEQINSDNHQIDFEMVTAAADWLRRTLDLTIFGFDVVVQDGTGDHVIVDVNYLPSFKEIPDDVAIPAFWDALKDKIVSRKKNKPSTETS